MARNRRPRGILFPVRGGILVSAFSNSMRGLCCNAHSQYQSGGGGGGGGGGGRGGGVWKSYGTSYCGDETAILRAIDADEDEGNIKTNLYYK